MRIKDFVTGIQFTKEMEIVFKISFGVDGKNALSSVLHILFLNSNKNIWNAVIKIELSRKKNLDVLKRFI